MSGNLNSFVYTTPHSINKFLKKNDWNEVVFIDPLFSTHHIPIQDLHFTFEMFQHIAFLLQANTLKTLILFGWGDIMAEREGLSILSDALLQNISLEIFGIEFDASLLNCLTKMVGKNENLKVLHVKDVYCTDLDNTSYIPEINALYNAITFENNNLLDIVILHTNGETPQYNEKNLLVDYGNFSFIAERNSKLLHQKRIELSTLKICLLKSCINLASHVNNDFAEFFNKIKRPIILKYI